MARLLNEKQIYILDLIAHGFAVSQIAKVLEVSTRTVESIRRSIVAKLETGNMTETVSKAITQGIIQYDPERHWELKMTMERNKMKNKKDS